MKANPEFEHLNLEFWANIKLLNQRLGYTKRKTKDNPYGGFVVPTVEQIIDVFVSEKLSTEKLIIQNDFTEFGKQIVAYMEYRGDVLTKQVEPNLMSKDQAKDLFYSMMKELKPTCPLPLNKQKNECPDKNTFNLPTVKPNE